MKRYLLPALLLISGPAASAQKTIRVWFLKGAKQSTTYGQLNGYADSNRYIVHVDGGQCLRVAQLKPAWSTHYASLAILDPQGRLVSDGDASCNSKKEANANQTGDYTVRAVECRKADAWNGNYRLRFTIK